MGTTMEIAKTEKFDLSTITVRVDRSPLTTRITALEVGEGFVVAGVDREAISSATATLRRDGRQFTTHKLGMNRFRVIRTA